MKQHFVSENKAYKHWTDVSLQLTPYNQYFIKSYDYRYLVGFIVFANDRFIAL